MLSKMRQRKRNSCSKEFLYTYSAGGFYQFNVYKITDAAHQVYYAGHPVAHGGTQLADTEEELKALLDKEVPILNDFLSKIDRGYSR